MENETMVTCFTCKGRGLVQESPTPEGSKLARFVTAREK